MKLTFRSAAQLTAVSAVLSLGGCLSEETAVEQSAQDPTDPSGPTNRAPTISGNPTSAVIVSESYNFTPQASDPDGDSLEFSIENQPSWANFDSTSGRLWGTPTLGNIGQYANITLSVSDGQASSAMAPFTVDVTQVSTSSTTLNWSAPTLNDDGTALTDLAGYKVYYGRSSRNYTNEIDISNASITTYVVENLSPDTYYFAATAVTSSGVESNFSGEVTRVID